MDLSRTRALIRPALQGDQSATGALLERLRTRLVVWAAGRMSPALRAKVEAEDVAQEVLLAIHKGLPAFEGGDERAFFGWVFRIAENRIRDLVSHFGAQKRQPVLRTSFSQTSPSMAAARKEELARVVTAIEALPEDYRTVIRLRRIEHREVAEVADLMGRSANAVRVLYCRAIKALKEAMDPGAGAGASTGAGVAAT